MRETLFRAKALTKYGLLKQDNGWIYGFPVPVRINAYITDRIEIVQCHGYDELDSYDPGTFKLSFSEIDRPTLEIMGNRWDNPELLKGE